MGTAVEVVNDDFDDLVGFQDEGLGVHAVDSWVAGIFAGGQGGGKTGYFLTDVGDVVERGSGIGISKM